PATSCSFLYSCAHARAPPSFPTRRSSDLHKLNAADLRCLYRSDGHLTVERQALYRSALTPTFGNPLDELLYGLFREGSSDELFRSEEHTSELQSREELVCRPLLEKKKHRT